MTSRKNGYCKLKEDALDRTLKKPHFGRGYRPVVRQTTGLKRSRYSSVDSYTTFVTYCLSVYFQGDVLIFSEILIL
jgi:hypothetical protein